MSYLIANLLGFVGLAGSFYLAGRVLDQGLLGGNGLRPLPRLGRLALGAALWIALLFGLATAGLLRPGAVAVLLVLMVVGAVALRRSSGNVGSVAPRGRRADAASLVLAIVLGLVLAALWLQTQWPQLSWDADVYHLTVPRLYLEHQGFRRIPFNVYSNWPLNVELLFALALLVKDHVLAKLIHFGFGCATLLLILRVAGTGGRPWAGWVAAVLFLANPIVLREFRVAYVDVAFAFFFFLAFAYLHFGLEQTGDRRRYLLLAGVFSGVAAGVKPTGFVAALCLAAVLVAVALRRGETARRVVADSCRLLLPALAMAVPWLVKTWLLTGNPVYPFLYRVFGGPEWSVELSQRLREWQHGIGMGREWSDYLLLPLRVIWYGERGYDHFDGQILWLWLLLIPVAIWASRRRPLVSRCLWLVTLYFVFWALSSQQMRFLIAVLPPLAVASAVAIAEWVERLTSTPARAVRIGVSLALAAILFLTDAQLARQSGSMLRDYLRYGSDIKKVAVQPAYRFIDEDLPQNAKLLLLNTNHGYFCRRDFIADSFFEASQINDLMLRRDGKESVRQLLVELGVSHLLIENRDRFVPWPASLYDFLNDPEMARLLYRSPDGLHDVVEVRTPEQAST